MKMAIKCLILLSVVILKFNMQSVNKTNSSNNIVSIVNVTNSTNTTIANLTNNQTDPNITFFAVDTTIPFINDMYTQGFPPKSDARLYKRFNEIKYETPDGVHGHDWVPVYAELQNDYNHISSPVPKVQQKRIIANDLPPRTITPSSFDYPKRENVIQVDLPQGTRKIISYEKDPNNLMKPLSNNYGDSLKLRPGMKQGFLQIDPSAVHQQLTESSNLSQTAESRADSLLNKIANNFAIQDKLIIPIITNNKNEKPLVKMSKRNERLKARKDELRHSIIGAKATIQQQRILN